MSAGTMLASGALVMAAAGCLCVLVAASRAGRAGHPQQTPVSWVINLARNPDRLNSFLRAYRASDLSSIPVERVDAIEGRQVDWSRFLTSEALERLVTMQRTGHRVSHPDLTPGAVGCYLSHVQAWRSIARARAGYGFVFEDDTHDIPHDTLARFKQALAHVPLDWDVLLLGCEGTGTPVGPGVMRMDSFLRMHAYAISAAAARSLSDVVMPIRQQIDWELSGRIPSGLKVYALHPPYVLTKWVGTDIQSPVHQM